MVVGEDAGYSVPMQTDIVLCICLAGSVLGSVIRVLIRVRTRLACKVTLEVATQSLPFSKFPLYTSSSCVSIV